MKNVSFISNKMNNEVATAAINSTGSDPIELSGPDVDDLLDLDALTDAVAKFEQREALRALDPVLPDVNRKPEAAEDYVSNFLSRLGLKRTLAVFQSEYAQLMMSGAIAEGALADAMQSPEDAQFEIQKMRAHISALEEEVGFLQGKIKEVKTTFSKLKKERDFHAMRHKQLVDERKRLTDDIQRLRTQMSKYEPVIEELEIKYKDALKSKMIIQMKKERLEKKLTDVLGPDALGDQSTTTFGGENTTRNQTGGTGNTSGGLAGIAKRNGNTQNEKTQKKGIAAMTLTAATTKTKTLAASQQKQKKEKISFPKESSLPQNPNLSLTKITRPMFLNVPTSTTISCKSSVACLCKHPTKNCVAAGFDDGTWKVYAEDGMQVVLTGGGHDAWIAGCAMTGGYIDDVGATKYNMSTLSPLLGTQASAQGALVNPNNSTYNQSFTGNQSGGKNFLNSSGINNIGTGAYGGHSGIPTVPNSATSLLATCGGDCTIRIWSLASLKCLGVLKSHQSPVWGCAFHCTSRYLVSASQDSTARLWDVDLGCCTGTLRGHVDSVNSCKFYPFGNLVATASGDKSVSLWDPQIPGQCAHTFFGHANAVNSLSYSPCGNYLASCDADGQVIVWETRERKQLSTIDIGPHSANCIEFDKYEQSLFVGSDDCFVRMIDFSTPETPSVLQIPGHTNGVQTLCVGGTGLLSGSNDGTIRIWN